MPAVSPETLLMLRQHVRAVYQRGRLAAIHSRIACRPCSIRSAAGVVAGEGMDLAYIFVESGEYHARVSTRKGMLQYSTPLVRGRRIFIVFLLDSSLNGLRSTSFLQLQRTWFLRASHRLSVPYRSRSFTRSVPVQSPVPAAVGMHAPVGSRGLPWAPAGAG